MGAGTELGHDNRSQDCTNVLEFRVIYQFNNRILNEEQSTNMYPFASQSQFIPSIKLQQKK